MAPAEAVFLALLSPLSVGVLLPTSEDPQVDAHLFSVLCRGEWCGLCYSNVRHRGASRFHLRFRAPRKRRFLPVASYLRKPGDSNGSFHVPANAPPDEWRERYPALYEFLTATVWADGEPRVPGTLTVFTEGEWWKGCLSDRATSRVAFISSLGPSELLLAIEGGIVNGTLEFRPQRRWGQGTKKN